jgi:glycerate dehydrogenase
LAALTDQHGRVFDGQGPTALIEWLQRPRTQETDTRVFKIVFLDSATFSPETVVRRPSFPHAFVSFEKTAPAEVDERIADADIVITNKVKLNAQTIARAAKLRLIAVAATGHDVIDLDACRARGVVVSNIRGYAIKTVPEHVFAMIFSLRRSLSAYQAAVRAGRWQEAGQFCFFDYPICDLAGSTLGIVGGGALGSEVARIANAFGMETLFAARKGEPAAADRVAFDEVLRRSDVITLHCPLTTATRGLIGDAEFAAMTRRPILINTARGGLVDEAALVRALDRGLISAAGFDVATTEPPPLDNPLMSLTDRPNFMLTPHVAWASAEAIQTLADQLIDNIEAFVGGAPKNRVA